MSSSFVSFACPEPCSALVQGRYLLPAPHRVPMRFAIGALVLGFKILCPCALKSTSSEVVNRSCPSGIWFCGPDPENPRRPTSSLRNRVSSVCRLTEGGRDRVGRASPAIACEWISGENFFIGAAEHIVFRSPRLIGIHHLVIAFSHVAVV